jgi:type IV pilus assembly protein PilA
MEQIKLVASCLGIVGIVLAWFAAVINAYQVKHTDRPGPNRRQAGFTVIELLIVVAILLIIAALAIPALFHSRMRANEASAVGSLKVMIAAESSYNDTYQTFSPDLASLGNTDAAPCTPSSSGACLIDGVISSGKKSSYIFTYTQVSGGADYLIAADPESPLAGTNHFCVSSDSIIRTDPSACTASSPALP